MTKRRFFVLGLGKFGRRAALYLRGIYKGRVIGVDPRSENVKWAKERGIEAHLGDGISFLLDPPSKIEGEDYLIPALPIHLAAYWLLAKRPKELELQIAPLPSHILQRLPHPISLPDNSCATSYATFICPEDCKEGRFCPKLGLKRGIPLYEFLRDLSTESDFVYVIQSRQLGPGMGGYKTEELLKLMDLQLDREKPIILATSCRCHGILSKIVAY